MSSVSSLVGFEEEEERRRRRRRRKRKISRLKWLAGFVFAFCFYNKVYKETHTWHF